MKRRVVVMMSTGTGVVVMTANVDGANVLAACVTVSAICDETVAETIAVMIAWIVDEM